MRVWVIKGKGHGNIRASHKTTLEFTKESEVTPKGDCILAVSCDKGLKDIPSWLKEWLLSGNRIKIVIKCGKENDFLYAYGHRELVLSHPEEIVIRKSSYIDERTLAIKASKAAGDLKRELIEEIKNGKEVVVEISCEK